MNRKHNLKYLSLISLFLVILSCTIPLATSQGGGRDTTDDPVQLVGYSGSWQTIGVGVNRTYASPETNSIILMETYGSITSGTANFTFPTYYNMLDSHGVIYQIDASIDAQRQQFSLGDTKNLYIAFQFKGDNSKSVYSMWNLWNTENLVGGGQGARTGIYQNNSVNTFDRTDAHFLIQFVRVNNTAVCVYQYVFQLPDNFGRFSTFQQQIEEIYNMSKLVNSETFVQSPEYWNSVEIGLFTAHDGSGLVSANITEISRGFMTPLTNDFSDTEFEQNYGGIVDWLTKGWELVTAALSIIWALAGVVFEFGVMIIPYLPYLLIAYLADACVKSIMTESIQPIGYACTTLYQMGMYVIQLIIQIVEAIGSLLPF